MRLGVGLVVAMSAVALAGCGGDERPVWNGPPRPLPRDGELSVEEFSDYVVAVDEPWERSAVGLATALVLPLVQSAGDLRAAFPADEPEGNDTVVVTLGRLFDDSVRELRVVVSLEPLDDGSFGVRGARWEQRCHPGRGHQGWSPAACR